MIATPNDVKEEQKIVREVIQDWNAAHAEATRLVLIPVSCDTDSVPAMGGRPQSILNKQILRDCDLLVAVFGARLGTDTGKAPSGTVEEIQEHLKTGKPAMVYFSKVDIQRDKFDTEQYAKLEAFKKDCKEQGIIEEYTSHDKFRRKFSRQLSTKIQEKLVPQLPESETHEEQHSVGLDLSEDAKKLLSLAEKNDGRIEALKVMEGSFIRVGQTEVFTHANPREAARGMAALQELIDAELIKDRGYKGEVFEVTHLGYQFADKLKS